MRRYLPTVFVLFGLRGVAQEVPRDSVKTKTLKDVVVTGQYAPQTLKNSVYNIRTISAEKIKARAATNIQQVLNTELGFRFSNDLTLGTTDVELMGMTGRNIKILLDGVPMVDRSDARESLNQIDINTVERIEIVEGPMSVVYGADALAGVINIITKKAGQTRLNVTARLQEETAGDEYNLLSGNGNHIQNLSASYQKNGWSILAGGTHNEFGGWNLASKTATIAEVEAVTNRWKPKEQWMGNTKIGYANDKFNIWYRLDGLNEVIDVRGGMNPNNYRAKFQTYTTERFTNQLQSELKVSSSLQLNAVLGYTDLQRATRTVIHDFTTNLEELTTDAGEQDVAKFNSTIFRATAQYRMNPIVSIQPGIEYNRDAASGARISGTPVINDYAFFVSSEIKPLTWINIRPGFRFIKNSVYNAPPVIPSLNTKFMLSDDLDLRLAYAKGFRSPALRELYYNFIDASHTILGNPNLKAESSNSLNGSLSWNGISADHFSYRVTLAGFYNNFKNRIEYGFLSTDATVTTLINVSKYKTTGVTLDNAFEIGRLRANVGFSYIGRYNQLLESSSLEMPEFVWSTEANASILYDIPSIKTNLSFFYKFTGSKPSYEINSTSNAATLVKVGTFNWADLMVNKVIYKYVTLNVGKQRCNWVKLEKYISCNGC